MGTLAKAWLEEKATWLFDLAHSDLDEDAIVKGFLKHYALQGYGINNVKQDIHFFLHYGDLNLETVLDSLRRALELQIESPSRYEMRTLDEVQGIVDSVRAGIRVQVDYYDPETDDNPYIVHKTW